MGKIKSFQQFKRELNEGRINSANGVQPRTIDELKRIIEEATESRSQNEVIDLNFIDTSMITDMHSVFAYNEFNYDISQWDVSKVKDMHDMFYRSKFNGDISQWNVSSVEDMMGMFQESEFNEDISQWDVSNVRTMESMFFKSKFNGDISQWNVSNVENMRGMFDRSVFNGDISQWDVSNVTNMDYMFDWSKFTGDISKWVKKPKSRDNSRKRVSNGSARKVVATITHDSPELVSIITDPTPKVMAFLKKKGYYFDECEATTNLILCSNNDESVDASSIDANASNFTQVLTKQCQKWLDDAHKIFAKEGWGDFEGEYECEDVPLIGYHFFDDVSKYHTGADLLKDVLAWIDDSAVDGDSSSASYIVNIDNGETLYGKGVEVFLYTSEEFLATAMD